MTRNSALSSRLVPVRENGGFTLIELAVVLVIVGIVIGGAMAMTGSYIEGYRHRETVRKMNKVADALAVYAQNYRMLPCPASSLPGVEPYGAPAGSEASGYVMDATCESTPVGYIGIVPFAVLGLNEDEVKDAYGNLLTYAVHPAMDYQRTLGFSPSWGGGGPDPLVNCKCAPDIDPQWSRRWRFPTTDEIPRPVAQKAAFCCPRYTASVAAHGSLRIEDLNGVSMLQPPVGEKIWGEDNNDHDATLRDGNLPAGGSCQAKYYSNDLTSSEIIAFALVSHGANGDGAFVRAGNPRPVTTSSATPVEEENRNNDLLFLVGDRTTIQNDSYYDDIVVWRTNHQLVSAFGNDSCGAP